MSLQVYPWSNHTRFLSDVAEAEANGFHAIFLTLDNPSQQGLRTRSLRMGVPDTSADSEYSTDRSVSYRGEVQNLILTIWV